MKTFIFPGQGSQARGMGSELFNEFNELVDKADSILGYSVKELCLEDPRRELNKTQFTQPALYVVNAMHYYKRIQETGEHPDFLAGHSLGEFNALLAAGCFDFEAGLKLVKKRGELVGEISGGGMAAILNASREKIKNILLENELKNIDLANYNTLSQTVISGSREEIIKAEPLFQQGDMEYYPLNTSGAFHSRYMAPAKEKFTTYLEQFKFNNPAIPVISNITAIPYTEDEVVKNLAGQIASSVRWFESIQYLINLGCIDFEEVGYGDVLTKMVAKIMEETGGSMNVISHVDKEVSPEELSQGKDNMESLANESINGSNGSVHEQVASWNRNYPVGSKVRSMIVKDEELETRTDAVVLFGHRAAIYLTGYNGYFDLDELEAL